MLTNGTVEKIGHLLGMPCTRFNNSGLPEDPSDGVISMSGEATYKESIGNRPPMLIFTGLCPGFLYERHNKTNSIYVLNLKTLKPTKNSYKQVQLPPELDHLVRSEMGLSNYTNL